jgi:endoglucanase
MKELHIILILIFIISLLLNYLSFNYKWTAIELVNDMGIGYNLGNTYNCCNIAEGKYSENEEIKLLGTILPTKNILKNIKKNGFKTVRFQILYSNYIYNNENINSEWIYKIKELIKLIYSLDMYLILSINHTKQFWDSEKKNSKDKYINFWTKIANEFINYDEHLVFESTYEIGYLTYLNKRYDYFEDKVYYLSQDFINIIRDSGGTNIKRLLIVPMISSEYELSYFDFEYFDYDIPKDPFNKLAISMCYYFPLEEYNYLNILEPVNLYNKLGYYDYLSPFMEWGLYHNYKNIINNFELLKTKFIDKGVPVIFGEVGILNDYIKRNNSIEQFLYTLFSMSNEYKGILPCLWDITFISSNYDNFYYNKETNEWSDDKYAKIFRKISKGNFIKSFGYYYKTNLETDDYSTFGLFNINIGNKKVEKVFVNVRFIIHIDDGYNYDYILTLYSSSKNFSYMDFFLAKKDGIKQYDGTSIFIFDVTGFDLYYYIQVTAWYGEDYMIINNITVQYEEAYLNFDHFSYKTAILNDINY